MYDASLSSGRATASQLDTIIRPRVRGTYRPVVYLHGSGSTATESVGTTTPAVHPILADLANANYIVGAPTATGTWGNSTGRSRLTDMLTLLRTSSYLAGAEKAVLIGVSHGSVWAFDHHVANPNVIAAIIGILPIVNLTAVRDGDVQGVRAGIDTAWGVAHPTALPAGADPILNMALLEDIPIQLFYSSDDTLSVDVDDFAAGTDAELVNLGALGHTNAAVAAVDTDLILDFLRRRL